MSTSCQIFHPARQALMGTVQVPGDKSITHRGILFGLLAEGTTIVEDWLDAADCQSSLSVARQLGAQIEVEPNRLVIQGTSGRLQEPDDVLDCGNSGTTTRMFLGALAARVPFACVNGDASLRKRPMRRVIDPLRQMGAKIDARSGNLAPFCVTGQPLHGISYTLPMASAQVKSAVLIAGLLADSGSTTVVEPLPSRDHTENMLSAFGARLTREKQEQGHVITVESGQMLSGTTVQVPGDISSAAFLLAAGCAVENSKITVQSIGLNPTRTGIIDVLQRMGAVIRIENQKQVAGELIGDVTISAQELQGIVIEPDEVPSMIDELPVAAVLAAKAKGTTVIKGAAELRVKETDRIAAVVKGLRAIGVQVEELEDGLKVHGNGRIPGGIVDSFDDHRIAMSFAIAGLASETGVTVQNWDCVQISYPSFLKSLEAIGVHLGAS